MPSRIISRNSGGNLQKNNLDPRCLLKYEEAQARNRQSWMAAKSWGSLHSGFHHAMASCLKLYDHHRTANHRRISRALASSVVSSGEAQTVRSTSASSAWAAVTRVVAFYSSGVNGTLDESPTKPKGAFSLRGANFAIPNLKRIASQAACAKHLNIFPGGAQSHALKMHCS